MGPLLPLPTCTHVRFLTINAFQFNRAREPHQQLRTSSTSSLPRFGGFRVEKLDVQWPVGVGLAGDQRRQSSFVSEQGTSHPWGQVSRWCLQVTGLPRAATVTRVEAPPATLLEWP